MSHYIQCATCGRMFTGPIFCSNDCNQAYYRHHVAPLIREQERLGADHMDDMLADDEEPTQ